MARSKVGIVRDIISVVKNNSSCSKTTIIRLANLDWDMASRYLNSLIKEGFLETKDVEENGNEMYTVTKKGELLLRSLEKIREICSIF